MRMYGTVFRYRVKPGMEERLPELLKEFDANPPAGFVAGWTYRLDGGSAEYITAVSFTDKDAYVKNADSPEQAAFFGRFRELLADDVEWNDGEIVIEQKG
jgi:antibiotic biosynthesis monooxygenase (ABM) superfamily enzyme